MTEQSFETMESDSVPGEEMDDLMKLPEPGTIFTTSQNISFTPIDDDVSDEEVALTFGLRRM